MKRGHQVAALIAGVAVGAVGAFACVCLAFPQRASAQTLTPGELRATAVVAGAQDRADAIRRRLDAPTSTPRPTLIPTDTPAPTNTNTPTVAPTTTTAPAPTSTPTAARAVATVALMSAPTAPPQAPAASGANYGQAALILALGVATIAGLIGLYCLIVGKTEIR